VAAGAAVATTQTFTLGTDNRVDAATKVTDVSSDGTVNPVDRALLSVENQSTTADATPLSLVAAPNHAPLKVNTGVKVTNLNADRLDGVDSSGFLPATGKAADSNLLDGLDSTAFTQGGGHLSEAHLDTVQNGAQGTLITVPGISVTYTCGSNPDILMSLDGLNVVEDRNGAIGFVGPDITQSGGSSPGVTLFHVLASRPVHKTFPFKSAVFDDMWLAGSWNSQTSTCVFQAVASSF
jgi:hypothetical protein